MLERVQHGATKMIHGFSGMDYGDRLGALNMYSLEDRRTSRDLIQVFKFIKQGDMEGLNLSTDSRTRGHGLKLNKTYFRREMRKHSFYNRVINKWNSLPAYVVYSKGVNEFGFSLGAGKW